MLSENYKKRIQELAGILSEDSTGKLKSFGVNDEIAKYLVSIDDKLALYLLNWTLEDFTKIEGISGGNIREILSIMNQGKFIDFIERNEQRINYVLEWIRSPFRTEELNLKQIKSLDEAYEMANVWHTSIEETGVIKDESGKIIKTYPKDGFYWIDLQTNSSKAEGDAMGHCGTDGKATTLISLRDTKKSPHVTLAYNANSNTITQVKGRKNEKPIPQYMTYVYDLLQDFVKQGKLTNFVWSYSPHGDDLDQDEIKFIFEGNLGVYINSILNKNLTQTTYFAPPFTREQILKAVGKEAYSEYITKLLDKNLKFPSFNLTLKKGDIIAAVGQDKYKEYITEFLFKALEDPSYKIKLPKAEIISVIGEDKYNEYVDRLLAGVLQDPIKNHISIEKDELFALLGEARYKEFISNVVKQIVSNEYINTEGKLTYVLREQGIRFDADKIKALVGPKIWYFFRQRSLKAEKSNIGASYN